VDVGVDQRDRWHGWLPDAAAGHLGRSLASIRASLVW
jgi:hypothetical protein